MFPNHKPVGHNSGSPRIALNEARMRRNTSIAYFALRVLRVLCGVCRVYRKSEHRKP